MTAIMHKYTTGNISHIYGMSKGQLQAHHRHHVI